MEDGAIVDLFLARDESAVSAAQEKYGRSLCTLAERICGDRETARECENDAYLAAWNSIPPHEPRNYLFAYLAALVRGKAINRARDGNAQKRSAKLLSLTGELETCLPGGEGVEETVGARELGRIISDWLRTLPEEKRVLFLRRYWFADPLEELCRRFSWSESRVKSALFRLRKELKQVLEKEGYGC